jgi:endonuclease/exonuclease/phosphatase family metal-dependent hydrolase
VGCTQLRVSPFNIPGGGGRAGRRDPDRISQVLREIDADVVALQEVPSLSFTDALLDIMQRELGLTVAVGRTVTRDGAEFGNALGSRYPFGGYGTIDLTVDRREPRNAIDARIDVEGETVRVIATHLGLRPAERRRQVRRLLLAYEQDATEITVLMGDINEWFLWGRPLRWLHRRFGYGRSPATYPTPRAMLALDRIWSHPPERLACVTTHRSPLTRIASDQLPLTGVLRLGGHAPPAAHPRPA